MKPHIIIVLFWILAITNACKEVYFPDNLDSSEKIPVISGIITENNVPVVTMVWATPYNERTTEYISNAVVSVSDDEYNKITLDEKGNGLYTTNSPDFKGTIGRTYTLHITLPDGNDYESNPVLMSSPSNIDSLYATIDTSSISREGLNIIASINKSGNVKGYFRFNAKLTTEYTFYVYPNTLYTIGGYGWKSILLDNEYDVQSSLPHNNSEVVPDHYIGFLQFLYDPTLETVNYSAPYIKGWVITLKVYTITQDVYNYYSSIEQQLNASDRIFSPIPAQIKSNIQCVNNQSGKVLGVFEASSFATIYKAFSWSPRTNYYTTKNLIYFTDTVTSGSVLRNPPPFWVYF